jgi:hypothetical protein
VLADNKAADSESAQLGLVEHAAIPETILPQISRLACSVSRQ